MSSVYRNKSVEEQVSAVREGRVTVQYLADSVRQALDRYEPNLHAWVEYADDLDAQSQSVRSGAEALPLSGISVGVKDLIDVAGLPTRAGSPLISDASREKDAACVARFRELGAVIQGKTVTTEFGYFSPGPTVNPYFFSHTPGGSSSGSAAAVGAATLPVALGTQTAGSLTRPASYCGAAGMVFAPGSTSLEGITGLSSTLDALGLLTQTVADVEYVWRAFTGAGSAVESSDEEVSPFVWDGSGILPLSPHMAGLVRFLPELLAEVGLASQQLKWNDHLLTLVDDHRTVMAHEAAETLEPMITGREQEVSPQLRALVSDGQGVGEEDYDQALFRGRRSRALLEKLLGENGVIVGPAASGPAPEGLDQTGSPDLSRPWQLLGLPAVVVPGARTDKGLPLGIQLIGLPGSEEKLFALGRRLEPLLRRLPALTETNTNPTLKDLSW